MGPGMGRESCKEATVNVPKLVGGMSVNGRRGIGHL